MWSLVFPDKGTGGFEAEARVLVDWLRKGKRFYRGVAERLPQKGDAQTQTN